MIIENMRLLSFQLAGYPVEYIAAVPVVHMLQKSETPGKTVIFLRIKIKIWGSATLDPSRK
jgi:hypothetical protein